jgi:hypothetical protein
MPINVRPSSLGLGNDSSGPADVGSGQLGPVTPSQPAGHYESYYLRGNHPNRPLAFWIRYTIFSAEGRPSDALGELWAIVIDGETDTPPPPSWSSPTSQAMEVLGPDR